MSQSPMLETQCEDVEIVSQIIQKNNIKNYENFDLEKRKKDDDSDEEIMPWLPKLFPPSLTKSFPDFFF